MASCISMKATESDSGNQVLQKVGQCLWRSRRSGRYYGIFTRGLRQVKRSLKTSDKELAKRRLESLRRDVGNLSKNPEAKTLTLADVAARYVDAASATWKPQTLRRRQTAIKALNPFFSMPIRNIAKYEVEFWASARARTSSPRTFNIERETLIQILNYAKSDGLILDNPASLLKRRKQPKPQIVIPTKAQFNLLVQQVRNLDARAHEAAQLIEFLAYSGCRIGEAVSVLWGDVHFDRKLLMITGGEMGTKNHEARAVPLFPALEALLSRMKLNLGHEPSPADKLFGIQNAKKAIISAGAKAKLPHFLHHSMRHFFCSNAIEAGVDFKTISVWLGHKDGGTLVAKTYGHLRDEHSAAMATRLTFQATTANN